MGPGYSALRMGPICSPLMHGHTSARVGNLMHRYAAAAGPTRKFSLNMVGMCHVQASLRGPGGVQHQLAPGLDNGCTISASSEDWFLDNWQRFLYPGSPAQLCKLEEPIPIGMFAGRATCQATHCVLRLPLQIGQGVYPVNLLIVKGGNFPLVLGNSFMFDYAARLWQRDFTDKESERRLILPLPQKLCAPGVTAPQPPPGAHKNWYPQQHVPLMYDVMTDTLSATPVTEYSMA